MQQVWLALNQAGLAVQPYYVVSDQLQRLKHGQQHPAHLAQAQQLQLMGTRVLGLKEGQSLAMLLRIGSPTVDPVRSRRLPLDQIAHTPKA